MFENHRLRPHEQDFVSPDCHKNLSISKQKNYENKDEANKSFIPLFIQKG